MNRKIDIVCCLYKVPHGTWVSGIHCPGHPSLVCARKKGRGGERLVLQHRWDSIQILPIDRAEVEKLIAKPEEDPVFAYRIRAFAEDRPQAVVSRRCKCLQSRIVHKAGSERRRGERQLRYRKSYRFVDRCKRAEEEVLEVRRVVVASEEHGLRWRYRATSIKPKRAINLGNQTNQLIVGHTVQRTGLATGARRS